MRDWLFMFMKDLVSLAAGYDCMFMSFVSTVCTTVSARQGRWRDGWGGRTQFVSWAGTWAIGLDHCKYQSHRLGLSIAHPSSPDTNHFHSNILCMRTGRIFFIKKIWWNGRIPRQRGFFGVDSSGYDNPAAIIVSAWGRKEWAWSKEVDWGFTVRDWNTSVVLLGYFIAMPIPPPQARQLLFVIGTSSYHRLKCWSLETDLEFKKPSQKNGCWNINIYNLSIFFYYQIWITHSSNFSFLVLFRH